MATEAGARQKRTPTTPPNTNNMGFILVAAAVVVALLLFYTGGGDSTNVNEGKTAAEIAAGRDDSTTTSTTALVRNITAPALLELTVGNGTGTAGIAKKTAEKLAGLGYAKAKAVDGQSVSVTSVYYIEGARDDAVAVAAAMGLGEERTATMPPQSPLKVEVGAARVVVLLGPDFDPNTAVFGVATQPGG